MSKLFTFNGNLDDTEEAQNFVDTYGTLKGKALANRLGFKGKNATIAANALSNYAWNKVTAISCRLKGDIETALKYERICYRIYNLDILNRIDCW